MLAPRLPELRPRGSGIRRIFMVQAELAALRELLLLHRFLAAPAADNYRRTLRSGQPAEAYHRQGAPPRQPSADTRGKPHYRAGRAR